MGVSRWYNSVTTKIWLFFGSDVNSEKYGYMHAAVKHQDENLINYLLARKANINLANKDGYTPLYLALRAHDVKIANTLFEKGAVLDMGMKGHATLLHNSVKERQKDTIEFLIKKGADINFVDEGGNVPTHYSLIAYTTKPDILVPDPELFKLLVDNGANLDACNPTTKATLLHTAVQNGVTEAVRILLDKSNQLNSVDESGNTAICYSIALHKQDLFDLLVKANADLTIFNPNTKSTLLHIAASYGNAYAVESLISKEVIDKNSLDAYGYSPMGRALIKGHVDIAYMLDNKGATLDVSVEGSELINKAAEYGHINSIGFLVNYGVDINSYDSQGNIPVYYALTGKNDVFKYICSLNGNVNFKDAQGNSLLHNSVKLDDSVKVNTLLKNGADVHTRNDEGKSPLYDALDRENGSIAKTIIRYESPASLKKVIAQYEPEILTSYFITKAAKNGIESVIEFYIQLRSDCSQVPNLDNTVYQALYNNHYKCAEKLFYKLGATFNERDPENKELLHHSVKNNWYENADTIIKFGISPDAEDSYYNIPLHYSIQNNNVEMVSLLLQHGASPNKVNPGNNKAPLLEAVEKGQNNIVTQLCNMGAKVDSKSFVFAINHASADIADYLRSKSSSDVLNSKDPVTGKYPVQLAIERGQATFAKNMLEDRKVKVVAKSEFKSILDMKQHYSESGSVSLVEALLNRMNLDINGKHFEGGQTFLHLAAKYGHSGIIDYLTSRGANKDIKDDKGETAADVAIVANNLNTVIAKLMPDVIPEPKKEVMVIEKPVFIEKTVFVQQPHETQQYKIPHNIQPSAPPVDSSTNKEDATDFFRSFKFLVNSKHFSESKTAELITRLFNNTNPSINEKAFDGGQTCLHLAVKSGNLSVVDFLKSRGANPDIKDDNGNTAADLLSGKTEVGKLYIPSSDQTIEQHDNAAKMGYAGPGGYPGPEGGYSSPSVGGYAGPGGYTPEPGAYYGRSTIASLPFDRENPLPSQEGSDNLVQPTSPADAYHQ